MEKQSAAERRVEKFLSKADRIGAQYRASEKTLSDGGSSKGDAYVRPEARMLRRVYALALETDATVIECALRERKIVVRQNSDRFSCTLRIVDPGKQTNRRATDLRYAELHEIHPRFQTFFRAMTNADEDVMAALKAGDRSLHRAAAKVLNEAAVALDEKKAAQRKRDARRSVSRSR